MKEKYKKIQKVNWKKKSWQMEILEEEKNKIKTKEKTNKYFEIFFTD